MIVDEITETGRIRHYSDQNLKIRQVETGKIYISAVDYQPCCFTYEETDEAIPDKSSRQKASLTKKAHEFPDYNRLLANRLEARTKTWAECPESRKSAVDLILRQDVVAGKITGEKYMEITGYPID